MTSAQPMPFNPAHYVQQATQMAEAFHQAMHAHPVGKAVAHHVSHHRHRAKSAQPIIDAFTAVANALAHDPAEVMRRNFYLYQSYLALMANTVEAMMGKKPAPLATPEKGDNRFTNPAWDHAFFDVMKQSYLLTSQWLVDTVESAKNVPESTRQQALFYTKQFVDAMAPTNFLMTNPEALNTALATQGQSLIQGFQNLMADIKRGRVSMTDYEKFKVGQTLATTPGKVVFRNKMLELIQYAPTTDKVHERPLLICPPWINRFYILDLQPHNSLVKYLTDQGFQVFMVSWKNPDASYRNVGFEDYITDGLLQAVEATQDITGQSSINVVGYCIGGTMLATALAALNAKAGGRDPRFNSATFFTTLVDFAEAGELALFISEQQIETLEDQMERDGVLNGRTMAGTFASLRSNDLVWSFVVNNYLMGKQPFPFDILYWNDDSTRMPAKMHSWYLRQLYQHNNLIKGKIEMLGQKVNIANITQPLYMVSAINDHITPWASCFDGFAHMNAESRRFVLSKAGHVAGVVNPPTAPGKEVKRSFMAGEALTNQTAEEWQAKAQTTPDSWWPDFVNWLKPLSGAEVKAPASLGNKTHKPLCAAPGTYVVEQ